MRPRSLWFDTCALAVVAVLVAEPGLESPSSLVFDEVYYVGDAVSHLEVGVGRSFQAHPPLGTWLIAAGIALLDGPAGWRFPSLVLAVVAVAALHRLAVRCLPGSAAGRVLAAVAPLLMVADGSWFVLARTAMLDGPLTALVLLATTSAAAAAQSVARGTRLTWLTIAGIWLGAAIAVKWSGAFAIPLLLAVLLALGPPERRRLGSRTLRSLGVCLAATAVVYAAAWVPFAVSRSDVSVATCPNAAEPCVAEGGARGVLAQHAMQVRYHLALRVASSAATPPSHWPLMQHPVVFHRADCHTLARPVPDALVLRDDCPDALPAGTDTVTYVGNAVVWLGFLALLPLLAAAATTGDRTAFVAVAGWTLLWAPWLLVSRTAYVWYLAPAVPFMALGVTAAVAVLPRSPIIPVYARASVGAAAGAAIAALSPLGAGPAILGWAVAGAVRAREPAPASTARTAQELAPGLVVLAVAVAVAAVMRSSWTG